MQDAGRGMQGSVSPSSSVVGGLGRAAGIFSACYAASTQNADGENHAEKTPGNSKFADYHNNDRANQTTHL
jgi:hypothetical protein